MQVWGVPGMSVDTLADLLEAAKEDTSLSLDEKWTWNRPLSIIILLYLYLPTTITDMIPAL